MPRSTAAARSGKAQTPRDTGARPLVMILSHYWPPRTGPGVHRWLGLAKHLGQEGWDCLVCTPQASPVDAQDPELGRNLPPHIEVHRSPTLEPYRVFHRLVGGRAAVEFQGGGSSSSKGVALNLARWIRGNLVVPDPRLGWALRAGPRLLRLLRQRQPRVLVTTGPPHSLHLLGLWLKTQTQIPWVADFRDPWSSRVRDGASWRVSRPAFWLHQRLESLVVQRADVCLGVSQRWAAELRALGANRVQTITNGYDEAVIPPYRRRTDHFAISHVGLLNDERNPEQLWRALDFLCAHEPDFARDFRLELAGIVSQGVGCSLARYPQLEARRLDHGQVSYADSLAISSTSALRLVCSFRGPGSLGNLPAKVFELLATTAPVLALTDPGSDLEALFEGDPSSDCLHYQDDLARFTEAILARYRAWCKGGEARRDPDRFLRYGRSVLATQLAEVLGSL